MEDERPYTRHRNERNEKKENKKNYFSRVVIAQIAVCTAVLVIAVILKFVGGNTYTVLRSNYQKLMDDKITVEQVKDTFKSLKAIVPIQNSQQKDGSKSTEKNTEAQTTAPAESQTAEPSETGEGGEDKTLEDYLSTNPKPPKSTSYAPYVTTVPITVPIKGKYTCLFGYRIHPITGKLGFHTGLDIAAKKGTKIAAAYYGTVKEVGKSEGYGNYIILEHADGLETFYGHCDSVLAQKNANVRAGETIAFVGSTGLSTGPHLHFEIRINGITYNPIWALNQVKK